MKMLFYFVLKSMQGVRYVSCNPFDRSCGADVAPTRQCFETTAFGTPGRTEKEKPISKDLYQISSTVSKHTRAYSQRTLLYHLLCVLDNRQATSRCNHSAALRTSYKFDRGPLQIYLALVGLQLVPCSEAHPSWHLF